jgi:hypothetical protein
MKLRNVGVSIDDRRAGGKRSAQPLLAADTRAGVVEHPDSDRLQLDDPTFGQNGAERVVVHVPDHRLDRPERAQVVEHACGDDIPRMQDDVGLLEQAQTLRRQPARTPRQMRVRDDRDQRQRLRFDFALRFGFAFGAEM